ncbi:MAG: sialidase family protein [Rikenellaceae bacterium]
MKPLKRLLLVATCFLMGNTHLNAQDLIIDLPYNISDTLSYTYSLRGGSAEQREQIALLTDQLLEGECVEIMSQNDQTNDDMIDLICTITDQNQIIIGTQIINFKNEKQASKLLAKYLDRYYRSGSAPTNTVVFRSGEEGYAEYRIPSIMALPTGRLLAYTEARAFHKDNAENNLVVKYSDDKGDTWSSPILIREEGESSMNNPCAIFLEESQTVMLIYELYPPKTSEANSLSGVEGDNIQKVFSITSSDYGLTWSEPTNITAQIKHPKASVVCSGPGVGIIAQGGKSKGRIIIPFNALTDNNHWFNYLGYSDDRGESWKILEGCSEYGTNESQIVEVADDTFMIFARCHRFEDSPTAQTPSGWSPWNFAKLTRYRAKITVKIDGDQAQWSSTVIDRNLPDPLCQGSALRLGVDKGDLPSRILVSNPASLYTMTPGQRGYGGTPPARINGTTRISYDGGESWTYSKRIFGNRLTSFGYSVLVDMGSGDIGTIYECNGVIHFSRYDLQWLTSGEDLGKGL